MVELEQSEEGIKAAVWNPWSRAVSRTLRSVFFQLGLDGRRRRRGGGCWGRDEESSLLRVLVCAAVARERQEVCPATPCLPILLLLFRVVSRKRYRCPSLSRLLWERDLRSSDGHREELKVSRKPSNLDWRVFLSARLFQRSTPSMHLSRDSSKITPSFCLLS